MLTYIPPLELTEEQLLALVRSFQAGPVTEWRSALDIAETLLAQRAIAFSVGGKGVMMCHVAEVEGVRRLLIDAAVVKGAFMRGWVAATKRLALDWSCDAVETVCYDRRLARAIVLCGAVEEAVVLKLEVGGEH